MKSSRGRHGQSSHSGHYHQTIRHILLRHASKREFGYQTLVRRMLECAIEQNLDSVGYDHFNWEDIRDVMKKGRWLGDEKAALLQTYLEVEEPDLMRSLDQTEFIERIGDAFSDFYIPEIFQPGTWDNAELRARLKLHDAYMFQTDHGSSKPTFASRPKSVDRYLILREAEGLPFLIAHEFSLIADERARRSSDEMTNLYGGFCLPTPDYVVVHSRSLKYRNFRFLVLKQHDQKQFQVSEIHIPKSGKRTLNAGKRPRSLIGPYKAFRLTRHSEHFEFLEEYLDKIGIGM